MTLLFDLQATQSALMGPDGGAQYARAVFRALAPAARPGDVAGYIHPDHPLDDDMAALVDAHGIATVPCRTKADLQALLRTGHYDRFMSGLPYNCHGLDFGRMEVFLAVHGLRPLEQRMPFHGRHYARGVAARAKWCGKYLIEAVRPDWRRAQFQGLVDLPCGRLNVVVPSWHTRYSLLEKLDVPPGVVIHDFYCPETSVGESAQADPGVLDRLGVAAGRYLLIVSGGRWIKNTWRALRAVTAVMDGLPDGAWLPVVVTGGVPGGLPRGRRPYVLPTGYLSEPELAGLYGGARALLYPTLNEGFGYPPLEAMAHGTPVLSSAVSSVTEIVGDAALYFNPLDEDEIRIRIRAAVEDDDLLEAVAERGRRRLAEVRARQQGDTAALCGLLLGNVAAP